MRRILISLATVLALWFVGRWIVRALVSDETRIQWTVDAMIEGFNETTMNPILDGLDRAFLDETHGADREMVRGACAQLFFQAKDETTKRFLYRAEWTSQRVRVFEEPDAPNPKAELDFEVRIFRRKGEAEEPAWKIAIAGKLEKKEGDWRLLRTEVRTLDGKIPR